MPEADIIILSWDRIEDTIDAIRSALAQDGVTFGIIVVDQGSEAGGLARLADFCGAYSQVQLIANPRNVGVPAGRNQGAAAGRAETIVFLDNDAVFADATCLRRAVARLRAQADVDALSFCVERFERPTGAATPDLSSWVYGARHAPDWWRKDFRERRFVGAGAALRRSAFEQVGGFDPELFFLHEEEDLSERLINRGAAIVYAGDIAIRHKAAPEHRNAWSGSRMFYHIRNRLYLDVKHGRTIGETLSDTLVILAAAFRGGSLWSALVGMVSGLIGIPRALAARRQSFVARTPEGAAYMHALAEEERARGVAHALDQYKGLGRFMRRLKWETGYASALRPQESPEESMREQA